MEHLVFIFPGQVCRKFSGSGGMESMDGLGRQLDPRTWNRVRATADASSDRVHQQLLFEKSLL